jgi:hypothetical protein
MEKWRGINILAIGAKSGASGKWEVRKNGKWARSSPGGCIRAKIHPMVLCRWGVAPLASPESSLGSIGGFPK